MWSRRLPSHRRILCRVVLLICVASVCYFSLISSAVAVHSSATPETTATNQTNITVTVAGQSLKPGETVRVGNDPSVTVNVTAASPVTELTIRTNGEPRASYTPNSTAVTRTATLQLGTGRHSLQVIVKTDTTYEVTGTLIEDSTPPLIAYNRPFETSEVEQPAGNYTVNRTDIVVAGSVRDISTVEDITITREYIRKNTSGSPSDTVTYTVPVENGTFRQPIELAPTVDSSTDAEGTTSNIENVVTVRATDPYGFDRVDTFNLSTTDVEPPNITVVNRTNLYTEGAIQVSFVATDAIGLRAVGRRLGTGNRTGTRYYFFTTEPLEQPRRFALTRNYSITAEEVPVTITASDASGQNANITITPDYQSFITPVVQFNRFETRALDDDSVFIRGSVSAGRITRVQAETRGANGTQADIETVYDGPITDRVSVATQLDAGGQFPVVVQLRALDSSGTEHTTELTVQRPTPSTATETQQSVSGTNTSTDSSQADTPDGVSTATRATPRRSPASVTDSRPQQRSSAGLIAQYVLNIAPFTIGSMLITILSYIILRRVY